MTQAAIQHQQQGNNVTRVDFSQGERMSENKGYTRLPHWIFDLELKPAELAIYAFIMRQTIGFDNRESAQLSGSLFKKHCGISSHNTINKAIASLETKSLINVTRLHGQSAIFSLSQPCQKLTTPLSKNEGVHSQKLTTPLSKNDYIKENIKKEKKYKETPKPPEGLASDFVFPDWLNQTAWQEFIDYKCQSVKSRSITDATKTKNLKTLEGLSHEQQQTLIDQTIAGGYKAILEPIRSEEPAAISHPVNLDLSPEELEYQELTQKLSELKRIADGVGMTIRDWAEEHGNITALDQLERHRELRLQFGGVA